MESVRLNTSRLLFRNLRESDLEAVAAYRSHPEAYKYIAEPMTRDEVRVHLQRCAVGWTRGEGESLNLGVELRAEGLVVGEVMVRYTSVKHRQVETGVALNPFQRHKRLGVEALLGLYRYCFEELGAHRVIGYADVENEAVMRVIDFIGVPREGVLRHNIFRDGRWHDEHIAALLEDEWPAVRERFADLLHTT